MNLTATKSGRLHELQYHEKYVKGRLHFVLLLDLSSSMEGAYLKSISLAITDILKTNSAKDGLITIWFLMTLPKSGIMAWWQTLIVAGCVMQRTAAVGEKAVSTLALSGHCRGSKKRTTRT